MQAKGSLSPAFDAGNTAVVTGAAGGIGLSAARALAARGLKVVLVDRAGDALESARAEVAAAGRFGDTGVLAAPVDVANGDAMLALRDRVLERFGAVSVLMNNAGIGDNPGRPWANSAEYKRLFDVNVWGVMHGVEAFVPEMLKSARPGVVINTGSKQGITSPPGNSAYNMSKAALKNYTESLAHALRNEAGNRVSAHLLIPGFTHTGMTGRDEKPAEAWTADQVVDFMFERLAHGDFYILCPDNAVTRAMDEKRMRWAMDDIILNRPALSRWHPDFEAEFARFMQEP